MSRAGPAQNSFNVLMENWTTQYSTTSVVSQRVTAKIHIQLLACNTDVILHPLWIRTSSPLSLWLLIFPISPLLLPLIHMSVAELWTLGIHPFQARPLWEDGSESVVHFESSSQAKSWRLLPRTNTRWKLSPRRICMQLWTNALCLWLTERSLHWLSTYYLINMHGGVAFIALFSRNYAEREKTDRNIHYAYSRNTISLLICSVTILFLMSFFPIHSNQACWVSLAVFSCLTLSSLFLNWPHSLLGWKH